MCCTNKCTLYLHFNSILHNVQSKTSITTIWCSHTGTKTSPMDLILVTHKINQTITYLLTCSKQSLLMGYSTMPLQHFSFHSYKSNRDLDALKWRFLSSTPVEECCLPLWWLQHLPLNWAESCSTCVIVAANVGSHLAKSSISVGWIATHIPF